MDDAIKCRYCGEWLNKRRGRLGGCLAIIASTIILIISLGYMVFTWANEHTNHGHAGVMFDDPVHLLSLIVVGASAIWTWRGLARRWRSKKSP